MSEACGGELSELTHRIARIGARGKYPNNCERDLNALLKLPVEPFWITVPVRDPETRASVTALKVPLLLPHQLYGYLFANFT